MLKKALFVDNSDVECLCDYGGLLRRDGRNLEAENQYLRALQLDPHSETAMRSYALLLHDDLHEYDKAEALYKRILAGSPATDTKACVLCSYARLLQEVRADFDGAEALFRQATQYGVLDAAAMKCYAGLLLHVREDVSGALSFYRKLLHRSPREESREVLALASRAQDAGNPSHAEGLLRLVLDVSDCSATHPEASWQLARLLMQQHEFGQAAQHFGRAFHEGYGSPADLFEAGKQLHSISVGGREDDKEDGNVAEIAVWAENRSTGVWEAGAKSVKTLESLRGAEYLYKLVIERDPGHAECAFQLALVTYRIVRHQDMASEARWATSSRKMQTARAKQQRVGDGMWEQVIGWLRRAMECGGPSEGVQMAEGVNASISIDMERVYELGVLMEKEEGRPADAACVLSLVAELSDFSHGPAVRKCAALLHHEVSDLDAAADMYANAELAG